MRRAKKTRFFLNLISVWYVHIGRSLCNSCRSVVSEVISRKVEAERQGHSIVKDAGPLDGSGTSVASSQRSVVESSS